MDMNNCETIDMNNCETIDINSCETMDKYVSHYTLNRITSTLLLWLYIYTFSMNVSGSIYCIINLILDVFLKLTVYYANNSNHNFVERESRMSV